MVRQRRELKEKKTPQTEGQCKAKQEAKMIMMIFGRTRGEGTDQSSECIQEVSEGPCWDGSHFVNGYK